MNRLHLGASKAGRDGCITINLNVDILLTKLDADDLMQHSLRLQRQVWVQVAEGEVTFNGQRMKAGDGQALSDEPEIKLAVTRPSQV